MPRRSSEVRFPRRTRRDWYASYGYVGGTGLRPINDAVPPVLR